MNLPSTSLVRFIVHPTVMIKILDYWQGIRYLARMSHVGQPAIVYTAITHCRHPYRQDTPEVVGPLRNAVGLINADECYLGERLDALVPSRGPDPPPDHVKESLAHHKLGRHENHLNRACMVDLDRG